MVNPETQIKTFDGLTPKQQEQLDAHPPLSEWGKKPSQSTDSIRSREIHTWDIPEVRKDERDIESEIHLSKAMGNVAAGLTHPDDPHGQYDPINRRQPRHRAEVNNG